MYKLTTSTSFHNHEMSTPVLDPEILHALDGFDPIEKKPAFIKKFIT